MPQDHTQDPRAARARADSIRQDPRRLFGIGGQGEEGKRPGLVSRLVDALLRAGGRAMERRRQEEAASADSASMGHEVTHERRRKDGEEEPGTEGGFLRMLRGR